jgi:putative effector of murein hydrolase LrgA (UPF0299 family)
MIQALVALIGLQVLGEMLVASFRLPLPGMLLLSAALAVMGYVPAALERTAGTLLQHMMLLFVPAVAGVMLHFHRVGREWQPFVAACVVGAIVTLAVTALVLNWLLRHKPALAP